MKGGWGGVGGAKRAWLGRRGRTLSQHVAGAFPYSPFACCVMLLQYCVVTIADAPHLHSVGAVTDHLSQRLATKALNMLHMELLTSCLQFAGLITGRPIHEKHMEKVAVLDMCLQGGKKIKLERMNWHEFTQHLVVQNKWIYS